MPESGNISRTPDRILTDTENLTNAKVNQVASGSWRIDENAVGPRELDSSVLGGFDTVADLRGDNSTYDDETVFNITGYHTAGNGDFGPSLYVDTSDTTSADDGVSVFVNVAGVRFKRTFNGYLETRWAGCKADGSTDDIAALNRAVSHWLANVGNGVDYLVISGGSYRIGSPLIIKPTTSNTGAWGIRCQGATIQPISSGFSGANVLQLINSPNVQQKNFDFTGPLLLKGSSEVTESVLLIDGSGIGASTAYTAWYKSVISGISIENFGISGGTLHGIIIRGNFHESMIKDVRMIGNEGEWNSGTGYPTGDGVRFEDGSYFSGGSVAHLRLSGFTITGVDRGLYQDSVEGSKFGNLRVYDTFVFRAKREGFYIEGNEHFIADNCSFEDVYDSNTSNTDYAKSAIYLIYGGALTNIRVRGNKATGQAKVAVYLFAAGRASLNSIRVSGSCDKMVTPVNQTTGIFAGFRESDINWQTNKPRSNTYDRIMDNVGIRDVVIRAYPVNGYDYSNPYRFNIFPNIIKSSNIVIDTSQLAFASSAGNFVDIGLPIAEYDRGDESTSSTAANTVTISEGHRMRITCYNNEPIHDVEFVFNSAYVLTGAAATAARGEAIAHEFQYSNSKWVELFRTPVWVF